MDFLVRDPASPSGVALIFIGDNGENSIAVAPGANGNLTPADVRRAKSAFQQAKVLLLQLETPLKAVAAAAELAWAAGVRIILNPAPARPLPDKLLRRLYLLTPNESEAELLTGVPVTDEASAAKAADALLAAGVGSGVVPAYRMKAVDTTAAGDVFNGTLAVALAEGKSLIEAARFASAAAALSVTRLGAQASAPSRAEIARLLRTRQ